MRQRRKLSMATLGELAALVGGEVVGDEAIEITGVAGLKEAREGMISLVATMKVVALARESKASAFIIPDSLDDSNLNGIKVGNPRLAYARILNYFHPSEPVEPGIHETA